MTDQIPLISIQVEQAVLGAMIVGVDTPEQIQAEHFYDGCHADLFQEITRRRAIDAPADPLALETWWKAKPYAAEMEGYLWELIDLAAPAASVAAYAKEIRQAAQRRVLKEIGDSLAHCALDLDTEPGEALEDAERQLAGLAETGANRRMITSAGMSLRAALQNRTPGTPSGWQDFDRIFQGWRDGRLYIGAGRPGMGKSLFGGGAALEMARRSKPAAFVSLEMSHEEVSVRLAASLSGVPYSQIERIGVQRHQEEAFGRAMETLDSLPFTVIDQPGASVASIRNTLRHIDRDMQRRMDQGLAFVCVDYLGLIAPPERGMGIYEATTKNSQMLKIMARELDLPVLCLAQLNRGVEQRSDKHPMLSDLRDSGAIEQDADAVFGLYREAYYAQQDGPPDCHHDEPEYLDWERAMTSKRLDVTILKQRGGETGMCSLYCDPATGFIRTFERGDAA